MRYFLALIFLGSSLLIGQTTPDPVQAKADPGTSSTRTQGTSLKKSFDVIAKWIGK